MTGFFTGFGALEVFRYGLFLAPEGESALALFLLFCAAAFVAYLFGSINSAVLTSRILFGRDVREYGSHNAGLTNMLRVFGRRGAVFTLLGDVAKSVISVLCGMLLCGYEYGGWGALLFCVVGHAFPCFFSFKGGKGVLSAVSGIACLSPAVCLCLIAIFLLLVLATRFVSLGSVVAALFFPLLLRFFFVPLPFSVLALSLLCAVLVVFLHRENVRRLIAGTEKKLGEREPTGDGE